MSHVCIHRAYAMHMYTYDMVSLRRGLMPSTLSVAVAPDECIPSVVIA